MSEPFKPYFSIVMPSYNQGKYLDQAITSVVTQSFPSWELIVLDGGSSDDSVKIIKKWVKIFPKQISWRSHKDNGQMAAINEGLDMARGQVIAYLNSDDAYLPNTLNKVARFFDKNRDCLWLVGNCKCSDNSLDLSFKFKQAIPYDKWPNSLYIGNFVNQPSVFLKRTLVKKVGKFDPRYNYAFDYDYWLRALKITSPCRLREDLSVFRIHSESKGNTAYLKQFDEDYLIGKKYSRNSLFNGLHWLLNLGIKTAYLILK